MTVVRVVYEIYPAGALHPMLLEEAEKLDMRAAICYEAKLNFPTYGNP